MLQITRQEQQQKLALTRSMQLSIHVLQMGVQALESHVEQELLENPFLDLEAPSKESALIGSSSCQAADVSIDSYSSKPSLAEHLIRQLDGLGFSLAQKTLAEKLVYCLDDCGFLSDVDHQLAHLVGASIEAITDILPLLQTLEPAGVFASNLTACLALQLHDREQLTTAYSTLLQHMPLIADGRHTEVCSLCEVSEVELHHMLSVIAQLNFRPCLEFDTRDIIQADIPEIIMVREGEQKVKAQLNPESQPMLLVNDALFSTVKKTEPNCKDNRYYLDCYNRAAWLVAALQKRANTMLSIGNELAHLQSRFILSGQMQDRVPLQMQTIATRLGLNKSTISRALANRSIKTDLGLFDAKVFFVRKANSQLENTTIDALLKEVQGLIRTETKHRVFSDQDLCDKLAESGLQVSRRSVSNYRKMLNIPSSTVRRENLADRSSNTNNVNFHF